MMRVADVIVRLLSEYGINQVFLVTGGGAMHLNDAFGRAKGMNFVACHHEQTTTMAAESYFRSTQRLAAVNVTTGPGGINALNGVYGAYTDSCGMVVISGQVKWETMVQSTSLPLRQLGDQEVDIISIVKPITKFAEVVTDPAMVRYQVEKALYLAQNGRPGPVWLDIPMNIQGARVEFDNLKKFNPLAEKPDLAFDNRPAKATLEKKVNALVDALLRSERPVILAGAGVRLSKTHEQFLELIDKLNVPVTSGWNAHDVIWNDHPLYVGRPGSVGDRAGNFAVQNSDFLLVLGSRLNIRQISYNWKSFARGAMKVMVDADWAELQKPTLSIDLPIHADLKEFFPILEAKLRTIKLKDWSHWLRWCKDRRAKYPVVLKEYWENKETVNPYCFVEALFEKLEENEIIVTGDGTACVCTFQAAYLKKGQRLYTNSGSASMGYDLPAAIGAYFANKPSRLICITGDGSIQMNLQELETIVAHKIPLKLFILNNKGYHSIRQSQHNHFPDNIVGCGLDSGLSFPSFQKLAHVYGFDYHKAENHLQLREAIGQALNGPGLQLCEVYLDLEQQFAPKLSSMKLPDGRMISAPLEDLAPFLPREELKENLLIPEWKEEV
jgi:acetolactate synthase-1/2/3 large subunit